MARPLSSPGVHLYLNAGRALLGVDPLGKPLPSSSTPSKDLRDVLGKRLENCEEVLKGERLLEWERLEKLGDPKDVEWRTGVAALRVLDGLHRAGLEEIRSSNPTPSIGVRDLHLMRTLASLFARWALTPLLLRLYTLLSPSPIPTSQSARIVELAPDPSGSGILRAWANLLALARPLLDLVRDEGDLLQMAEGSVVRGPPQGIRDLTPVAETVLTRHAADVLRAGVAVGWASVGGDEEKEEMKGRVKEFLNILPSSLALSSLGSAMSPLTTATTPPRRVPPPPHVCQACSSLMTAQLLRPGGIEGLLDGVFGREDGAGGTEEAAPLAKLEHVARLLGTPPRDMDREAYYRHLTPLLLSVFSPPSTDTPRPPLPQSHATALAFTFTRLLETHSSLILLHLAPHLHAPLQPNPPPHAPPPSSEPLTLSHAPETQRALTLLSLFLLHAPPSPKLFEALLTPVIPPLFGLLSHLEEERLADPVRKEEVRALLRGWGRVVGREEGVRALWEVVRRGRGWGVRRVGALEVQEEEEAELFWGYTIEGPEIRFGCPPPIDLAPDLFTAPTDAALALSNPLSLRPDPDRFTRFLKDLDRKDVAADLFVRTLQEYEGLRTYAVEGSGDAVRTMLYLQLVLQMSEQLGSTVLKQPEQILSFINHALDPSADPQGPRARAARRAKEGLEKLRIVDEDDEDVEAEEEAGLAGDSDDEDVDVGGDELVSTAVTLLLAILEAHEDLTIRNAPLLGVIFSRLDPLASSRDPALAELAREARLVLSARSASTSTSRPFSSSSATTTTPSAYEQQRATYQEALRLVQDPLLPVRAHGLHLLRQLVSSTRAHPSRAGATLDPALVPGILDVFLQAVQAEDSFVFLNAVKGLAGMVDVLGREVLSSLGKVYAGGVEKSGDVVGAEMDKRLRVGEALIQVIQRCGQTLPAYADVLIPPLLAVFRSQRLPTVLRASALAILAQAASTSALALLPYSSTLISGALDLLSLESVQRQPAPPRASSSATGDAESDAAAPAEEPQPIGRDPKHPTLRRSALLLLALLLRSAAHAQDEGKTDVARALVPPEVGPRLLTVVRYVWETDADALVRHQAGEVLAEMGVGGGVL